MNTPSEAQVISDLIESYGELWEPEPPLYSCDLEVISVDHIGEKLIAKINHTIVECDGIEVLLTGNPLPETDWPFETVYVKDEATNKWKFDSSDVASFETARKIEPVQNIDATCLELIFNQLDWYDYLATYEMKSTELMAALPEKYHRFYQPHHQQFLDDNEFV